MDLGNFSISLTVKDLPASRAFYEALGFGAIGGDGQRWLILQNGAVVIGLFHGMFERNTLTFNPGWDASCATLPSFTDVRELQRRLEERGIQFATKVDPDSSGPGSFVIVDPDGNPVLFDQHV